MAKSAVMESTSANNFPFGKVQPDVRMKRKTPSELRGEQLKRWNSGFQVSAHMGNFTGSDKNATGEVDASKKSELKLPKYINTRLSEVFAVKKSGERFRDLYDKATTKSTIKQETSSSSKLCEHGTDSSTKGDLLVSVKTDYLGNLECPKSSSKVNSDKSFQKIENCSLLRNVVELHSGTEKSTDSTNVDMEKALKGLVARDIHSFDALGDFHAKNNNFESGFIRKSCTQFNISGGKPPLDFTLKTAFRLVSSSSVKWYHRLTASHVVVQFNSQFNGDTEQQFGCINRAITTSDVLYTKALQSWIYPQTSLPNSLISIMTTSAAKGEKEFLSKRQEDWENSFRSVYYLLRKKLCNIFYVRTSLFIAMFIGGNFLENKHSCNAYISQSSRSLRSVLKKQGISFSMPLCSVEDDQAIEEDLVELAEIEKGNYAQTIHIDSMSDVDNSPQSLLALIGNDNAHALYDFLLNYRFFLNSLSGVDVPVIYAPAPFHNASLSIPEVKCKELMRADAESLPGSKGNLCCSIEIKDTILPPWVISGICAAMSSEEKSFESSLSTEPASLGLNVALDSICEKTDCSKDSNFSSKACDILGICETVPSAHLRSASLKNLNYSNSSYAAHLSLI